MIARLSAAVLILCVFAGASPIAIGGLSYVSSDADRTTGGFMVTDPSGVPMPYRCEAAIVAASCSAYQPRTVQWMLDYSDSGEGAVSVVTPGVIS